MIIKDWSGQVQKNFEISTTKFGAQIEKTFMEMKLFMWGLTEKVSRLV